MRTALLLLVILALVIVPMLVAVADETQLARHAAALPALKVKEGRVALPLTHKAPYVWQAIHPSVKIEPAGDNNGDNNGDKNNVALGVSYQVAASTPAGVALLFPPGTLTDLATLAVKVRSEGDVRLTFSLRDRDGLVYSFPSASVRGGAPRTLELAAGKLRHDPFQPGAPDPGSFDTGAAILLSIVDISGFMGGAGRDAAWSIESIEGVRSQTGNDGDAEDDAKADAKPEAKPADTNKSEQAAIPGDARALFFEALNRRPELRDRALKALTIEYLRDPKHAATTLYLGLAHLWSAAEGERSNPQIINHLYLSESFLVRAQRLAPDDQRIPSWLVPVQLALAGIERRDDERVAILEPLHAAFRDDPCFHGFALGLIHAPAANDSDEFRAGLAGLRALLECDDDDATAQNLPRWPHNIEGTLLLVADYELRAGDTERARAAIQRIQAQPTYASWPYQAELDVRVSHLESGTAPQPTSEWVPGHSCQVCHRGP